MMTKLCPRSLWRVIALSVVTFGLYYILWMGLTWSEMRRQLQDDTMHPVWHVLTQFVPVYGWFRLYAHFETINDLVSVSGSRDPVNPTAVVMAMIVAVVLGFLLNLLVVDGLGELLVGIVSVWFVAHAQAALNAYWTRLATQEGLVS